MSFFKYMERNRAVRATFYTALVLISFIVVVIVTVKYPEIVFPIMVIVFVAIVIGGIWFFIYKTLK